LWRSIRGLITVTSLSLCQDVSGLMAQADGLLLDGCGMGEASFSGETGKGSGQAQGGKWHPGSLGQGRIFVLPLAGRYTREGHSRHQRKTPMLQRDLHHPSAEPASDLPEDAAEQAPPSYLASQAAIARLAALACGTSMASLA